jgi:HEAT repeat protein
MTSSRALTCCVTLMLVLPLAHGQQGRGSALRVPLQWQDGQIGDYAFQPLASSVQAPRGVELPESLGGNSRFVALPFGEQQVLHMALAFDGIQPRLWVDRDFDADLAEEEELGWQRESGAWHRETTVLASFTGEALPLPLRIELRCQTDAPFDTLEFLVKAHKTGSVVIGDRERAVAVCDETSGLDLSAKGGVVLLMDIDGDGRLAAFHGSHEHFHRGEVLQVGKRAWNFHVIGRNGGSVLLVPAAALETPPPKAWQEVPRPQVTRRVAGDVSIAALLATFEKEKALPFEQRRSTVFEIGRVGSRAAFAMLQRIVDKDRNPLLRAEAIRAMGRPEYQEYGASWLREQVKAPQLEMAEAAVAALYLMRDPGLEELLRQLSKDKRPSMVAQAAEYLAYLASPEALRQARKLLRHPDAEVRLRTYHALRCQEGGPAPKLVMDMMSDQDPRLRAMALRDLHVLDRKKALDMAWPQARSPDFECPELLQAVVSILLERGAVGEVDMIMQLVLSDPWRRLDDFAVPALARLRKASVVASYRQKLGSQVVEERLLAARIFAAIGGELGFSTLVDTLEGETEESVRASILEAMGTSGSPQVLAYLLEMARVPGVSRRGALAALGEFGLGQPEVRSFLLGMVESRFWEDRVLAIDAIAASGDVALAHVVLPALEDESWQVRLAAIEALRQLRIQAAVAPLVDRIQVEEHLRLRRALGQTLFMLTGQSPHMSPEAWAGWWRAAAPGFRMSVTVPRPRRDGGTVSGSGFYGLSLDSDRVVFVIDQSGSMQAPVAFDESLPDAHSRLQHALANALRSIEVLKEDAMVDVVLFHSGVDLWKPQLMELTQHNRKALQNYLAGQSPGGAPDLFDGLEMALQLDGTDRILLLSDGEPTAGRFTATEDILREVAYLNRTRRIVIDCVSLGIRSSLLERLAAQSGGRYIER